MQHKEKKTCFGIHEGIVFLAQRTHSTGISGITTVLSEPRHAS
jgi:hypothetical protein